jgi:hypothetical protein
MVIDNQGIPLGDTPTSASPAEGPLVEEALNHICVRVRDGAAPSNTRRSSLWPLATQKAIENF